MKIPPNIRSPSPIHFKSFSLALTLCLVAIIAPAAEQTLFDFSPPFDAKSIGHTDAEVTLTQTTTGSALTVSTGHKEPWPGVTLHAPDGHWDLSPYAAVWVRLGNAGTNTVTVYCRVDNPGADGMKHCVTGSLMLNPGRTNTLRVPLPQAGESTLDGKLFGMRGYPAAPPGPDAFTPANVTQILLFVTKPSEDHHFSVADIRAGGTPTPPTAWVTDAQPFFPFIDTFGQYKHKDWPGKVHSLAELQQRRADEAAELAANPGPANWDKYGGLADGPQLEATGFFRVQKVDGKWWFVDPDGHLFWSQGIDCVQSWESTPVEERATWFDNFPGDQPGFGQFFGSGYALKGHYAGRTVKSFSFSAANLQRKYGDDWKTAYADTVHRRLRSWGLNTIGNWSDPTIYLQHRTPYTDTIGSRGARMIEGSEGYWGRFPDVFDPGFAAALRQAMAAKTNSSANDPWCLGYFSDNEMSWGDATSLSLGVLHSPADQPAKQEFVKDLRAKYTDIAQLNSAWGTTHTSWDELLQTSSTPDAVRAHDDLTAFYSKLAETYFHTVRDAIKAVAPNHLYLGCRFAWVNDLAARAAGKYCDVVSYNHYRRGVADLKYPGEDRPLLVGEFHFGALDRGMFHTGLVPTESQTARAAAYHAFVLSALRDPRFVGVHWFQWQDEPNTGRVYDEENYQIGFIDVADTPYAETIATCRQLGKGLYEVRINESTSTTDSR